MCGIVSVFGSGILEQDKKVFKQLLQIDTLRGEDSTGVIRIDSDNKVSTFKRAIDGWGFTSLSRFSKFTTGIQMKALVGHNRYATMGAVNDENAHPFVDKNISMVHNGSLTSWTNLHKHLDTKVDSEAICFNIAKEGIKSTIKKLNGAFAIIAFDKKTGRLNIFRNTRRPLFSCKHKHRDVVYVASEVGFLNMIADRNNLDIEEIHEFKEKNIYSFDLTSKLVKSSVFIDKKVEYYTYHDWHNYNNSNTYRSNYGNNYSRHLPAPNKNNTDATPITKNQLSKRASIAKKHLIGKDLCVGDKVLCTFHGFTKYPGTRVTSGILQGLVYCGWENTYSVAMHGMLPKDLSEKYSKGLHECVVRGLTYDVNKLPQDMDITVNFVRTLKETEEFNYWDSLTKPEDIVDTDGLAFTDLEEEEAEEADTFLGPRGVRMVAKDIDSLLVGGCSSCGDPLSREFSCDIHWALVSQKDCPVCYSCAIAIDASTKISGNTFEDELMGGGV